MTLARTVIGVAVAHLGEGESPPGSNRTTFGAWYGVTPAPWCAEFVSYCLYVGGFNDADGHSTLPGTTTPKGWAYVPYMVDAAKAAGTWRAPSTSPQPGWAITFDWDGDGEADHVGLVDVDAAQPDGVHTIEGNTHEGSGDARGDTVSRRVRGTETILGYIAWPYAVAPSTGLTVDAGAPPWPGRFLCLTSPFMKGDDVLTWQRAMLRLGWTIHPDGVYGAKSEALCKLFQAQQHLKADGVVGPITWRAAMSS